MLCGGLYCSQPPGGHLATLTSLSWNSLSKIFIFRISVWHGIDQIRDSSWLQTFELLEKNSTAPTRDYSFSKLPNKQNRLVKQLWPANSSSLLRIPAPPLIWSDFVISAVPEGICCLARCLSLHKGWWRAGSSQNTSLPCCQILLQQTGN